MYGNLLPIRLLGFGFYWAWLFLVCVSPSLLMGPQLVFGLPLEAPELALRIVFIAVIMFAAKRMSTKATSRTLLGVSLIAGTGASALATSSVSGFEVLALVLMACADAAMFMLWLCFFGNKKVGEIAVYIALSYTAGSILCLGISILEFHMAQLLVVLLPILSGISFYLSYQHYMGARPDGENDARVDSPEASKAPEGTDCTNRAVAAGISHTGQPAATAFDDTVHANESEPRTTLEETTGTFPYMGKLTVALGLYALMFGLITSVLLCNHIEVDVVGPAVEAPCAMVIGFFLAAMFVYGRNVDAIYKAYRIVPLVFGLGLASLLIAQPTFMTASSFLIMAGYLLFEILALNDFCNAVKIRGLDTIRVLGIARLGISCGMLAGWMLGIVSTSIANAVPPIIFTALVDIPVLIVASTLVFTEKEIFAVRAATDERLVMEENEKNSRRHDAEILREASDIEDALIGEFGRKWGMSKREMEVLPMLLRGKTIAYISEQLFIATGTTKTHVYNIYQKLGIHTKMELIDMFDEFRRNR